MSEFFDGSVNDVRIYDTALSADQVQSVYSVTSGSHLPNLITSADQTTFTIGTASSFSMLTDDGSYPGVTFTETGALPSGVTLSPAGVLSGTPAAGTDGTWSFLVDASDGISPDGYQAFTLTVNLAAPSYRLPPHWMPVPLSTGKVYLEPPVTSFTAARRLE